MKPKIRVLDLFSGIGGFSLGLERTGGFETVAFCENNKRRWPVLEKHWPDVPIIPDVKRIDTHGLVVDLVTAGFPCQDISLAGRGAGLAGSRSRLFWRVIRTAGLVGWPRLLLENVAALLQRGMGTVLGALASVGYDAEWHCIPASAIGAPHVRDRVWIVADHECKRRQRFEPYLGVLGRPQTPFPVTGNCSPEQWCQMAECVVPVRNGDGVPVRVERDRIEGAGNAVVPQIPELIGNAILESIGWHESEAA